MFSRFMELAPGFYGFHLSVSEQYEYMVYVVGGVFKSTSTCIRHSVVYLLEKSTKLIAGYVCLIGPIKNHSVTTWK